MDLTSFVTSLTTSLIVFVVLMLLFTWLSRLPGNKEVYYPNRILRGMDPFEGGFANRNPFAWIKEAFTSSEQDIIEASGVDTAVYFVFLSTGLLILCLSASDFHPISETAMDIPGFDLLDSFCLDDSLSQIMLNLLVY